MLNLFKASNGGVKSTRNIFYAVSYTSRSYPVEYSYLIYQVNYHFYLNHYMMLSK